MTCRTLAGLVSTACLASLILLPGCAVRVGSVQSGARIGYVGSMVNGNADHRVYEFRSMNGRFQERLITAGGRRLSASASIGGGELDIEVTGPDGGGVIKWVLTADQPEVAAAIDGEFAKGVYTVIMRADGAHSGRLEFKFGSQPELVVALDGA